MGAAGVLFILIGGGITGEVSLLEHLCRSRAGIRDQGDTQAYRWLNRPLLQIDHQSVDAFYKALCLCSCLSRVASWHHPDKDFIADAGRNIIVVRICRQTLTHFPYHCVSGLDSDLAFDLIKAINGDIDQSTELLLQNGLVGGTGQALKEVVFVVQLRCWITVTQFR